MVLDGEITLHEISELMNTLATCWLSIRLWMGLSYVVATKLYSLIVVSSKMLEFWLCGMLLLLICCIISCSIATFTKHFGRYGELVDSVIMKDCSRL